MFSIGWYYLYLHKIRSKQKRRRRKKNYTKYIHIIQTQFNIVCSSRVRVRYRERENESEHEREWSDFGFGLSKPFFYFHLLYFTTSTTFPLCYEIRRRRRRSKIHEQTPAPPCEQTNMLVIYIVYIEKCVPVKPKRIWSVAFCKWLFTWKHKFNFQVNPHYMCLRIHTLHYIYYYVLFVRCETIVIQLQ